LPWLSLVTVKVIELRWAVSCPCCVFVLGRFLGFDAELVEVGSELVCLSLYIARPAVSEKRLSLLNNGHVRYELKTPFRDGTHARHLRADGLIARLVALVPKPRANLLTRRLRLHVAR
jgi:hypothetical protein